MNYTNQEKETLKELTLEKQRTISILKSSIKHLIDIKSSLIEMENNEKASLFRGFEKKIEKQIDKIENIGSTENKPKTLELDLPESNFSKHAALLINTLNTPVYTNKIAIAVISRVNPITSKLLDLGFSLEKLRNELHNLKPNDFIPKNKLISHKAERALLSAFQEARYLNKDEVSISILLLSILRNQTDSTTKLFNNYGIYYSTFTEI